MKELIFIKETPERGANKHVNSIQTTIFSKDSKVDKSLTTNEGANTNITVSRDEQSQVTTSRTKKKGTVIYNKKG